MNNNKKTKFKPTSKVQKKKISISVGVVNVYASFNNTIISISDIQGSVICWSSTGKHSFKGSRKATPYAAQIATLSAIENAKTFGLQSVYVKIFGPGVGREASLRAIQASNLAVLSITDNTYHPHNGCRPAKRRRV